MPEIKLTDETRRRLFFATTYEELTAWLKLRALADAGLPHDTDVADLKVDVGIDSRHSTFVRGTVPMTREHLLEKLGLTPTEPVETDGAAVAATLDCHDEAGRPVGPQSSDLPPREGVSGSSDGHELSVLRLIRETDHVEVALRTLGPTETVEKLTVDSAVCLEFAVKVVSLFDGTVSWHLRGSADVPLPLPDAGEHVRVDLMAEKLSKSLEVDRCLALLRLRLDWLKAENERQGSWGAAVAARNEEVGQISGLLRRYGGDRLVPRPVTEDVLRAVRVKLRELADAPLTPAGRATASDLHYVLSLLGGEL